MEKTVIHVGPSLTDVGGIASVLRFYSKYLTGSVFISSVVDGARINKLTIFASAMFYIIRIRDIKKVLFHLHSASFSSFYRKFILAIFIKIRRGRYIAQIHGSGLNRFYDNSPSVIKFIIRWYLINAEIVITMSTMRMMEIKKIVRKNINVEVVSNPVQSFPPRDYKIKERVLFLFGGFLIKAKGIYDLIDACSVLDQRLDFELFIAGPGEVAKVKEYCYRKKLEKRVRILGGLSQDDYFKLLQKADVFILPSYSESFGLSVLEAMASGIPVIFTECGGISIKNGENGLIIKQGDVKSIASAMEYFISNPRLVQKIGQFNYQYVKKNYNSQIILEDIQRLYGVVRGDTCVSAC